MARLRYLFYVAFAVAALFLCPMYFKLVVEIFPFLGEPACSFEFAECPPPSAMERLLGAASIYATVPLIVLLFWPYRRWVRRLFGMEDGWS